MHLQHSTTSHAPNAEKTGLIPAALRTRSTTARNVPVVAGLCLAKGRLAEAASGHVDGFASAVRAQFEVLNRWSDGSVRWMLTSFIAPEVSCVGSSLEVYIDSVDQAYDSVASNITTTVKLVNEQICIFTRDLTSDPPTERTLRLTLRLCDSRGEDQTLKFDGVRNEVAGAVRQTIVVSAHIESMPFVTLQLRLNHWTSAGLLQVETRIRNTRRAKHIGGLWDLGDVGSFSFRSLEIAIQSDDIPASAMTRWKTERHQSLRSSASEVALRQFGSGGPNWSSSNHITSSGQIDVLAQGFEVSAETGMVQGLRAEPTFMIDGDSSFLAVAVPEFWQQFPGGVAAAKGKLEVGLFPAVSSVTYELQGGEQKTKSFWLSSGSRSETINDLDWVFDGPRLLQSTASIMEANTLPWFHGNPTCLKSGQTPSSPGLPGAVASEPT